MSAQWLHNLRLELSYVLVDMIIERKVIFSPNVGWQYIMTSKYSGNYIFHDIFQNIFCNIFLAVHDLATIFLAAVAANFNHHQICSLYRLGDRLHSKECRLDLCRDDMPKFELCHNENIFCRTVDV